MGQARPPSPPRHPHPSPVAGPRPSPRRPHQRTDRPPPRRLLHDRQVPRRRNHLQARRADPRRSRRLAAASRAPLVGAARRLAAPSHAREGSNRDGGARGARGAGSSSVGDEGWRRAVGSRAGLQSDRKRLDIPSQSPVPTPSPASVALDLGDLAFAYAALDGTVWLAAEARTSRYPPGMSNGRRTVVGWRTENHHCPVDRRRALNSGFSTYHRVIVFVSMTRFLISTG